MAALIELGRELLRQDYAWTCPSLATQTVVNGRFTNRRALNLTDLFGWNREGHRDTLARQLPALLIQTLCETGVLQIIDSETVRSRVRFSTLADTLLAHSAWPATEADAVVVGPDTQRCAAFVARELQGPCAPMSAGPRPFTLVALGCGSGAVGIMAARLLSAGGGPGASRVLLTDRNPHALRFAEVNARLARLPHVECRHSDLLAGVGEPPMLVLAHPPGLSDRSLRADTRGGGELGTGQALRTVDECLDRLLPGGTLLMCAEAPVVRGVDVLWRGVAPRIARAVSRRLVDVRYQVLDPDVVSPHMAEPACADVERLMRVGLSLRVRTRDATTLPSVPSAA